LTGSEGKKESTLELCFFDLPSAYRKQVQSEGKNAKTRHLTGLGEEEERFVRFFDLKTSI
jgi:hypothetical protein